MRNSATSLGAVLLLCATAVSGSDFTAEAVEQIRRLAHAVAPEIGADALLRVAVTVPRRERAELIELAFRMADNARFPVRGDPVRGPKAESRFSHLAEAYSVQMDAVSLKCRAVRQLLPVEPSKARELFGQIILPVRRLSCKEQVRPNYEAYYQTAAEVVQRGFTPKEIKNEEPIRLLESLLRSLQSLRKLTPQRSSS